MPVAYREFASVDNLLRQRADASSFRATYAENVIEVFRRYDADVADMLATFGIGERAGHAPRSGSVLLLRFELTDEQARLFCIQRMRDGEWHLLAKDVAARDLVRYVDVRSRIDQD